MAETKPRRRRARVVKPVTEEVDFQTAPVAEPAPAAATVTKPRRRARVIKPAEDEVDFQIAPIAEPESDRPRRRPVRPRSRRRRPWPRHRPPRARPSRAGCRAPRTAAAKSEG